MSHAHAFDYHFHIQACAQGRSQALHTLFQYEAPRMLALADTWLAADEPRARQAVSDTFLLIWRHASHYPGQPGHARAWLYSILRHRLKYDRREQERLDPVRWHSLPELRDETLAALSSADKRALQAAYCLGCSPQALSQLTPRAQAAPLRQTLADLVHGHGLAESALAAADHQALAAYVLGITDDLARRRAESLLQSEPVAARLILHWEEACLVFVDALAPAPGADALLTAICQQLQLPAPAPAPFKPARPSAPPSPATAAASVAVQARRQTQEQAEAPTPLLRVPASNNGPVAHDSPSAAETATAPPAAPPSPTPAAARPAPAHTAATTASSTSAATTARQDAHPGRADTPTVVKQPDTPSPSAQSPLRAEPVLAAQPQPPARTQPQPYASEAAPRRRVALLPWAGALAIALSLGVAGYRWMDNASQAATPAPPPSVQQVAVLQAPGSSSTPGWLLTQDSDFQLSLKPLVSVELAPTEAVYLWTQALADPAPRLLARIMPDMPLRLTPEQIGPVQAGQVFEMTLEPIRDALPTEPEGPVLFIGRAVGLDDAAPARSENAGASDLRNP